MSGLLPSASYGAPSWTCRFASIESKIACGPGNSRRTHKDFADVVELIAVHGLSRSYARYLHESVRATFRELVTSARGGK